MSTNEGKHPKGYWMGIGISLGVAIGAALGLALENIGAGIGIGVAIGAGIGTSLEQRNKDNLRPLTEEEKQRQKRSIAIGLALTAVLAMFLIIVYFLQARWHEEKVMDMRNERSLPCLQNIESIDLTSA